MPSAVQSVLAHLIWPAPARADFSIHAKSEHGPRGQFRGREPRRSRDRPAAERSNRGTSVPPGIDPRLLGVGARLPEAALRREPRREVFKHIFKTMEQHILCDCFVPSLRRSLNYDDSPLESILSRRFFQKCLSPFRKSTPAIAPFFQARRKLRGLIATQPLHVFTRRGTPSIRLPHCVGLSEVRDFI